MARTSSLAQISPVITTASVEGEYPEFSSQRSCCVTGANFIRQPAARSTNGKMLTMSSAFCFQSRHARMMGKATSSSCIPDQYGVPLTQKFCAKAAVRPLRADQIHQRAQSRFVPAHRHQCGCCLDHVARPYQVVAAQVVVAFRLSPGNRCRRDKGALKCFVFMRQQNTLADVQQASAIAGRADELSRASHAMPLLMESFPVRLKARCQRLYGAGQGCMAALSKPNGNGKFRETLQPQFPPSAQCCRPAPGQTPSSFGSSDSDPSSHRWCPRTQRRFG